MDPSSRQETAISAAVEQWISLARMGKDGVVAAITQSFDLWERECRRLMGAVPLGSVASSPMNPAEVWAEGWKTWTESWQRALDTTARRG